LELLNKVLVGDLSKTSALVSVEVDVVNVKRRCFKRRDAEEVILGIKRDTAIAELVSSYVALVLLAELENDLYFVVLEGDQWQCKTGVAAEPELEGNIESSGFGLSKGGTSKSEGVANHIVISYLMAGLLRELVPDVKPITILFINALSTDFNFNVADENVADVVDPSEAIVAIINIGLLVSNNRALNKGKSDLKVNTMNKITIAGNGASNSLAEVSSSVKDLLNRLHREVSVTTIHNLEKSNLGVSSEINILSTIGYELHQTT
jgi:hypothetical protein